jgi:7-carboxy-7-deazaguanine synthase
VSKFTVVEKFLSLEGEAAYTNRPTVYVRLAKCNFKCAGFNNPARLRETTGYAKLEFSPKDVGVIWEVPTITRGCDSQYATNPEFKHLWIEETAEQVLQGVLDLLPGQQWQHPETGLNYIFSITGGEPLMHWKVLPELLSHPFMGGCKHIIFETNGAVPAKAPFYQAVSDWVSAEPGRLWTWSVSPKLSSSGESYKAAIKPDIVVGMASVPGTEIYLKYVISGTDDEFNEVVRATSDLGNYPVWIMPMACTDDQQREIDQHVARECLSRGYNFSYRTQNALWGNGVGT